jgi:hypothetical protein
MQVLFALPGASSNGSSRLLFSLVSRGQPVCVAAGKAMFTAAAAAAAAGGAVARPDEMV